MYMIRLKKIRKKNIYLIALIKQSKFSIKQNKVIELFGVYDFNKKKLTINIFRLIFWISKNVYITGKLVYLLILFDIINNII